MADSEHLAVIREGIDEWNQWRASHPSIVADLRDADLSGQYLEGGDFSGARLEGADLSYSRFFNANLIGADLTGANLLGANLVIAYLLEANLSDASLIWANLSNSILTHSDLRGSNLMDANFSYADLRDAKLEGAFVTSTVFGSTDLTGATGLDSCRHGAPSVLDYRTIANSGRLPISFLRGCGLSDTQIEFIPSLLQDPVQFYSCFISYSSKDKPFVERLHRDLQDKGVRCWFAPDDLKIGDKIRSTIDESIRLHDKLLLVLSENSVSSQWVEKEVETAMEKERQQNRIVLFPVRLDESFLRITTGWPADVRRARHIGDFQNWRSEVEYQRSFSRLIRDLKAS